MDATLDFVQNRAADREAELLGLQMKLELSRDMAALRFYPEWASMERTLRPMLSAALKHLATKRLDGYALGSIQARINTLSLVLDTGPLSDQEIAGIQDRIQELRELLEIDYKLLR